MAGYKDGSRGGLGLAELTIWWWGGEIDKQRDTVQWVNATI